ncbi:hypothetical protein [Dubosiella newyorkensis]|nr:hypothetical protein [Dubosiella newyorkensis]
MKTSRLFAAALPCSFPSFIVDVGHFDLCLHDVGHSFSERGGFHV